MSSHATFARHLILQKHGTSASSIRFGSPSRVNWVKVRQSEHARTLLAPTKGLFSLIKTEKGLAQFGPGNEGAAGKVFPVFVLLSNGNS